jgi:hypothetical protein
MLTKIVDNDAAELASGELKEAISEHLKAAQRLGRPWPG